MTQEEKTKNLTYVNEQNLVGFFELLLKIDKRVNPNNYKLGELDKSGHKVYGKNIE